MVKLNFLEKIFHFPFKKDDNIEVDPDTVFSEMIDELRSKEIAFYIATSYIANTIAKCPFKVFSNNKEVKDDLYYRLNVKSNTNETASRLKYQIIDNLYYKGESLIFEYRDNLYCADSFQVEEQPLKGNIYNDISIKNEIKTFSRKREDVFYFNLENDRRTSKVKSLIDTMYEDYKNLLNYAITAYKMSNSEKYILDLANVQSGDQEFIERFENTIKKQLKNFIDNPRAVYPQFYGYKLENITKSSQSTNSDDIRNIKKDVMETVAEAFKMPVSMLYGNMTNVKDIISHYLTFTIDPIAEMISQELTSNSFTVEEWKNGCYVKVDTTAINHLDIFEIADKIEKTISTGIFCIDEIRTKLGETPLNTEFSKKHFITKNYATVDEFLNDLKGGEKK